MKKSEVIEIISSCINEDLQNEGFIRGKKNGMEYSKSINQIKQNFSFSVIERYDTQKRCLYFKVEPFVSVFNSDTNRILNKAFDLDHGDQFNILACQISDISNNPTGECKVLNTSLDIRYYPGLHINEVHESLKKSFISYGLPFYEKFNNLNDIYNEISKPEDFSSVYCWITPRRLIYSIVVSHVLKRNDTKALADSYKKYFDFLKNEQLVLVYKKLYDLLF